MRDERARNSSVLIAISSLLLGIVVLGVSCTFSSLVVTDTWFPAVNTQPKSLIFDFQRTDFTKEIVVSNMSGSSSLLLTIWSANKSVSKVYVTKSADAINTVGVATWNGGYMYAVTSNDISSGKYVISAAHAENFNGYLTNTILPFLVIDDMHTPTGLETLMIEYSPIIHVILATVLTAGFSLAILPLLVLISDGSPKSRKK